MTAVIHSDDGNGCLVIDYTGEAAIGLQGNILNPEGARLLIIETYFLVIAPSTLAATLNVGHAATGVDDASFHGALPLQVAANTAYMGFHPAVTQDAAMLEIWEAAEFLTFTTAAQSALPCTGKVYIKYVRIP